MLGSADMILTSAIEVGIGLVGFTGLIVTLLGKNRSPTFAMAFSTLLIASIAIVMFSFLPLLLVSMSIVGEQLWIASSAAYVVYWSFIIIIRTRQTLKLNAENQIAEKEAKIYSILGAGFFLVGLLQISNIVFFQQQWPYLCMIIYYVLLSLVSFSFLIRGVKTEEN
jgi:hypothetical protein